MIITCGCSMTVSRSFASSHRTKTLRHIPETIGLDIAKSVFQDPIGKAFQRRQCAFSSATQEIVPDQESVAL
jgi:hypothetical protein